MRPVFSCVSVVVASLVGYLYEFLQYSSFTRKRLFVLNAKSALRVVSILKMQIHPIASISIVRLHCHCVTVVEEAVNFYSTDDSFLPNNPLPLPRRLKRRSTHSSTRVCVCVRWGCFIKQIVYIFTLPSQTSAQIRGKVLIDSLLLTRFERYRFNAWSCSAALRSCSVVQPFRLHITSQDNEKRTDYRHVFRAKRISVFYGGVRTIFI